MQIGRAPDLAIVVSSDKSVSRVHAQLEIETSPTGQQQLRLRDLGSRFGTNLNGVLIKPNESALVEGSEAMVEVGGAGTTILLQQRRLSLCMSSMLKKDKDRVKAAARALQGTITAQADGASHVVIERMNATAKVLTALTQGTPLVTPQWMDFALTDRALVPVPEEAAFFPPAAAELSLCPAGRSRSNALSQLTVIVLDPSDLAYLPILSGCGAAVLRAYDMPWDAFLHSLSTTVPAPPRECTVAVFFDENQQQEAPADLMQQIRDHVQAQAAVSWLTVGQLAKAVFTLCTPLLYLAAPRCRLTQGGAGVSQSQAAGGGGGYLSQVRMAAFSQQHTPPLPLPLPLPPPTPVSAAPAPLRKCAPPTPIPTPAPPSSPVWASAARKRGRGTPEEVQGGGGGVEEMSVLPASKRRCDPCAPSSAAITPSALKVSLADDWDDVPVPSIPAPVPASAPVLAPASISAPVSAPVSAPTPVTAVPMKAVAVAQPISKPSPPPPSAAAIATASAAVFPAPAPARAPAVPSSSSSSSSSSAHVPASASASATSAAVKQHKPTPVSAPVIAPVNVPAVPHPPHPHSTSSSADDGEGDGDWVTVEHNSLHHHHQVKQQRTTEGEEQGGDEEEEVEGVQPEVEERALLVRHSVPTSSSTSSSSSSSGGIGGAAVGGAGKGMRDVRCFVKNSTRARAGRQVLTLGSMDRVLPRESERELQLRLDFEALQAVEDQARSMMDEGSAATRKGRKR